MIAFKSTRTFGPNCVETVDKLNKFSHWMQYRFRLYRKIIRRELISVGCTDLNFDVRDMTLHVKFKFNGIKYYGLIDIDDTCSYNCTSIAPEFDKISIWEDNEERKHVVDIINVKKDFGKNLIEHLLPCNSCPLKMRNRLINYINL